MKALVLDDMRTFIFPEGWEVIHARTAEHAVVEFLRGEKIDAWYVDHDLGQRCLTSQCTSHFDRGTRVTTLIDMLCQTGQRPNIGTVYLTTSNSEGQRHFRQALERLGFCVARDLGPATLDATETAIWSQAARLLDQANNPYS